MKTFSTEDVAQRVGVHRITLQRWISADKVRPSLSVEMKGRTLWRWTQADVEKVRKFKAANYRKGRGRKKGTKKDGQR